jgi:multiple antibiotic resistance protein
MHELLVTFVALFVAVDIIGVLPVYLGFVASLDTQARRRVAAEASLTAAGIGTGFLFLGDAVLHVMGVSVGDFQMAGGLLLLLLAIHDLLQPGLAARQPLGRLGVVPLGTPLIVGPAVMMTLLTLARSHGYALTVVAFGANLVLVWLALRWAPAVVRVIGEAGAQAMAKVFGLLLAAIGVTFIRRGLELTLREGDGRLSSLASWSAPGLLPWL